MNKPINIDIYDPNHYMKRIYINAKNSYIPNSIRIHLPEHYSSESFARSINSLFVELDFAITSSVNKYLDKYKLFSVFEKKYLLPVILNTYYKVRSNNLNYFSEETLIDCFEIAINKMFTDSWDNTVKTLINKIYKKIIEGGLNTTQILLVVKDAILYSKTLGSIISSNDLSLFNTINDVYGLGEELCVIKQYGENFNIWNSFIKNSMVYTILEYLKKEYIDKLKNHRTELYDYLYTDCLGFWNRNAQTFVSYKNKVIEMRNEIMDDYDIKTINKSVSFINALVANNKDKQSSFLAKLTKFVSVMNSYKIGILQSEFSGMEIIDDIGDDFNNLYNTIKTINGILNKEPEENATVSAEVAINNGFELDEQLKKDLVCFDYFHYYYNNEFNKFAAATENAYNLNPYQRDYIVKLMSELNIAIQQYDALYHNIQNNIDKWLEGISVVIEKYYTIDIIKNVSNHINSDTSLVSFTTFFLNYKSILINFIN